MLLSMVVRFSFFCEHKLIIRTNPFHFCFGCNGCLPPHLFYYYYKTTERHALHIPFMLEWMRSSMHSTHSHTLYPPSYMDYFICLVHKNVQCWSVRVRQCGRCVMHFYFNSEFFFVFAAATIKRKRKSNSGDRVRCHCNEVSSNSV